jgi:hypothetical protein
MLLGTRPGAADRVTSELTATEPGPAVAQVSCPAALPEAVLRPDDVLVVVTDGRRATRAELARAVAAAEASAAGLAGVVLEGGLPAGSGWRQFLGAALRGDLPLPRSAGRSVRARGTSSSAVVAALALFAAGLAYPLPAATTTALAAALVLLPVWISAIRRFRGAVPLFTLAALGLVCGLLLAGWSAVDHEFAARPAREIAFLVLGALGALGLLLWSRTVLPLPAIGVAYGLGLLAAGIADAPGSVNAFKFELSLPLTIVVLSLVSWWRRPVATLVALAVLGLADITHDARSAFGFCAVAAGLVLWQARPARPRGRINGWPSVLLLGAAAVGAYYAISELLVSGVLGAEVQARSETQIRQTGSLLLGGRPEWTATWALMRERPLGFGLGTVPDSADVLVARSGFAVTHIPTAEGYIENFMLATRFELHSIAADLWAALGPAGLALGVGMAAVLIHALAHQLGRGRASGLACLLSLTGVWYLAFGTLPSNVMDVALALGMLMLPKPGRHGPAEGSNGAAGGAEPAAGERTSRAGATTS